MHSARVKWSGQKKSFGFKAAICKDDCDDDDDEEEADDNFFNFQLLPSFTFWTLPPFRQWSSQTATEDESDGKD